MYLIQTFNGYYFESNFKMTAEPEKKK